MAAETIGEMQKKMDEASEQIGKAEALCEGKLTTLKLKSNCMEADGLPIKPEKAMLIPESTIDLEGKRLISEFYLEYRQIHEWKHTRARMQWDFEAKIKAAMDTAVG